MDKTKNYYNQNVKLFIENTINSDMSKIYIKFEKFLRSKSKILDIGCGSGRDSQHFKSKGYIVTSIDYSEEICKEVSLKYDIDALCMDMRCMEFENSFDAIWACASLLHIKKSEIDKVLMKCHNALKINGIFYMSFKEGEGEREINQRFFNFYTKNNLIDLLKRHKFKVEEFWETSDVRPDQKEINWLNIILRKE